MTDHARVQQQWLHSRGWWTLPGLCVCALLWLLHAELLLSSTIPASYDLTGHLYPIAELQQRLLPHGRVHGWSAQWFTGFPLFYFYFPLPALIACAFSAFFSLEAALKVTSVFGVLAFPVALYVLYRAMAASRAHAAVATTIAASFLLMQSFWYLGGNVASTLAGEFAFSISFTLALFYLATLLRASGGITSALVPGVLLATVALSHLVTTVTIVLVSAALLFDRRRRLVVAFSWLLGFLLSAFWTVPFLLRHGELAEVYANAQRALSEVLPLELWAVLPAAIAGLLLARRDAAARPLLFLTSAGMLLYLLAGRFVYPGRFLPYWFLGLHMLAGFAIAGLLLKRTSRDVVFAVLLLLPIMLLHGWRGSGYLREWSQTTFAGLQNRDSWPELQALMQQLQADSGAVYWEQAPQQLAGLGSRNLASVTPYLAPGQRVLNGLWLESSRLHDRLVAIDSAIARAPRSAAPQAAQQMRSVIAQLADLGVSRFVALNLATAELLAQAGAQPVHASQRLVLFRFAAAPRVQAQPAGANVHIMEWSDEHIRFRTDAVGAPHLVHMSYFPNWRADGAAIERGQDGLLRVVPTRSDVTLVFATTWVERVGTAISVFTAAGWLAAVLLRRRRRARQSIAS